MQILVQFPSVCALYGNGDLLLAGGLLLLDIGEAAPALLFAKEDPAGDLTAPGNVSDTCGGSILHQSF